MFLGLPDTDTLVRDMEAKILGQTLIPTILFFKTFYLFKNDVNASSKSNK
jgi:hypothetical protein